MNRILLCILLFAPCVASALEQDKQKHLIGSMLITMTVYAITEDAKSAILVGMGAGLAKELYDSRAGGSGFDVRDLAADAVGVGVVVIYKF